MIKVYTLPNCKYCDRAKTILKQHNIEFEEINLKDPKNREAREYYRSLGVKTAPIIVSEDWIIKDYNDKTLLEYLGDIV